MFSAKTLGDMWVSFTGNQTLSEGQHDQASQGAMVSTALASLQRLFNILLFEERAQA